MLKVGDYCQEAYGEISIYNIGMRRIALTRVFKPVSWASENRSFPTLENEAQKEDFYVSIHFFGERRM